MYRLSKMKKYCSCAGRRESCRYLTTDMAGFAQATDDQLPTAGANKPDSFLKRFAKAIGQRIQRPGFVVQDGPSKIEHAHREWIISHGWHLTRHSLCVKLNISWKSGCRPLPMFRMLIAKRSSREFFRETHEVDVVFLLKGYFTKFVLL